MEHYVSYIKGNKVRKDHVGHLCTELLNDDRFNAVQTEQEFINYVNTLVEERPEVTDAVLDLKKEMGFL